MTLLLVAFLSDYRNLFVVTEPRKIDEARQDPLRGYQRRASSRTRVRPLPLSLEDFHHGNVECRQVWCRTLGVCIRKPAKPELTILPAPIIVLYTCKPTKQNIEEINNRWASKQASKNTAIFFLLIRIILINLELFSNWFCIFFQIGAIWSQCGRL